MTKFINKGNFLERRSLSEILLFAQRQMKPEELFIEAGYDDDSIEQFYMDLKRAIKENKIKENRPNREDIYLEAITDET